MTDLAAFLTERITEDEQDAQAAIDNGEGCLDWADAGDPTDVHIARWDPARVLAECEAKRRIIAEHRNDGDGCPTCVEAEFSEDGDGNYRWPKPYPCPTLRALAEVYRDHPDFDPAWLS